MFPLEPDSVEFKLRCPDCLLPGTCRLEIWLGFDQLAEREFKVE
jgi:hypothetical protein